MRVVVAPNDSQSPREAVVHVGGRAIRVAQAGVQAEGRQTLQGRVEALSGACPDLTWRLSGTRVAADKTTAFIANGCSRVREGTQVEVRGEVTSGVLYAKQVRIID